MSCKIVLGLKMVGDPSLLTSCRRKLKVNLVIVRHLSFWLLDVFILDFECLIEASPLEQ